VPDANEHTDPPGDEDEQQGDLEPADEIVEGEIAKDRPSEGRRLLAASEFSGPLPPPRILSEYDQIKPGLAEIIIEQWQMETRHRHQTIDGVRDTDHSAMRAS
jgi:uncharacterized membrane protein